MIIATYIVTIVHLMGQILNVTYQNIPIESKTPELTLMVENLFNQSQAITVNDVLASSTPTLATTTPTVEAISTTTTPPQTSQNPPQGANTGGITVISVPTSTTPIIEYTESEALPLTDLSITFQEKNEPYRLDRVYVNVSGTLDSGTLEVNGDTCAFQTKGENTCIFQSVKILNDTQTMNISVDADAGDYTVMISKIRLQGVNTGNTIEITKGLPITLTIHK